MELNNKQWLPMNMTELTLILPCRRNTSARSAFLRCGIPFRLDVDTGSASLASSPFYSKSDCIVIVSVSLVSVMYVCMYGRSCGANSC